MMNRDKVQSLRDHEIRIFNESNRQKNKKKEINSKLSDRGF